MVTPWLNHGYHFHVFINGVPSLPAQEVVRLEGPEGLLDASKALGPMEAGAGGGIMMKI